MSSNDKSLRKHIRTILERRAFKYVTTTYNSSRNTYYYYGASTKSLGQAALNLIQYKPYGY